MRGASLRRMLEAAVAYYVGIRRQRVAKMSK